MEQSNSTTVSPSTTPVIDSSRFSDWFRLVRVTARVIVFVDTLNGNSKRSTTMEDLEKAKLLLYQQSQQETFGETYNLLRTKQQVENKDKLQQLSPFLDNGIIRARGRLRRSPLPDATKHQIILNAKDPIVRMMIENAHRRCMHHGTEYVRNYQQQSFVIIGLRKTLRQIRHNCFLCRRFQGKGLHPLMPDLPPTRFNDPSDDPFPFKNTGIDDIVPFSIATKDTTERRYIRLFTCLSICAVHLESTENLTTNNRISAIRRFIARRGTHKLLISDNATYFVGARKQLRSETINFNGTTLTETLQVHNVEWHLNPPAAPYFGGVC